MYVKKDRNLQKQIKFVSIEDLVPENHLLREVDRSLDFSFIYEEVKGMYSEIEWGKPGIDPVSLFKIVLIQYMCGIRSMRQTIKEIEVNMAYRWFIGYDIGKRYLISPRSGRTTPGGSKEQRYLNGYLREYLRKRKSAGLLMQALFLLMEHTSKPVQTRRGVNRRR